MGTPMDRLRHYRDEPMARVALRARLMRPWWRRRFAAFGEESILHRPTWVYGPRHVEIGHGVIILGGMWLSVERVAWGASEPVIRIGDGVGIRPHCTISAASSVIIEDNVVLSAFTTVVDSDHVHGTKSDNVLWSDELTTAPVRIGKGTWVGERVAVLSGATIGKHCTVGANSVVRGTIPDYSVAVGVPARVVGTTRERDEDPGT